MVPRHVINGVRLHLIGQAQTALLKCLQIHDRTSTEGPGTRPYIHICTTLRQNTDQKSTISTAKTSIRQFEGQRHRIHNVPPTASSRSRPSGTESGNTQTTRKVRIKQELRRLQAKQTPTMGELEPGHLHLHPVLGHPPWHGNTCLAGQIRRPRLLDRRADAEHDQMGQCESEQVLGT